MTSRERFELGQEAVVFQGLPAKDSWVNQVFIGGRQMGKSYFDTCDAGPQLAEYQAKAGEQNAEVLAIFQRLRRPLSPSQVLARYPNQPGALLPPLTSIRRAICVLTQAGALVKTEVKRKGMFGRNEFCWTLPEAKA